MLHTMLQSCAQFCTVARLEDDAELALADLVAQADVSGVDLPLAHDRLLQRLDVEDLVVHQPTLRPFHLRN